MLIAGVGQTGVELIYRLGESWEFALVDEKAELIERLRENPRVVAAVVGDATSDLVLRRAGIEQAEVALALTESDEENLEIARLASQIHSVPQVVALVRERSNLESFQKLGENVKVVFRSAALATLIQNEIELRGRHPEGIGLGEGEIIEVTVAPDSPYVGRKLRELSPLSWIVAAVYRNNKLIVPDKETVILAEDRVLLVGDKRILPTIVGGFRGEDIEFPLQYGELMLVTIRAKDPVELVLAELDWIYHHTKVKRIDFVELLFGRSHSFGLERLIDQHTTLPQEAYSTTILKEDPVEAHKIMLSKDKYGLIVFPPPPAGSLMVVRRETVVTKVSRLTSIPLIILRGTHPWRRLLVPLSEGVHGELAIHIAISLARQLGASVTAAVVSRPHLLTQEEEKTQAPILSRARHQARLRHVGFEELQLTGNPVMELVKAARNHDLIVLGVDRLRPLSFFSPDLAAFVAHHSPITTLLVGHE